MSGPVKWFSSNNFGAPELTNDWGCLIDVLDACLVNGFGSQPITSLQISDGVGIATFPTAHHILQFQWIEISGADNSAINTEFKVIGLTTNSIEFLVDLPDQVISGNLLCKLSGCDWGKVFSGNQKGVYQAKDTLSNPYFLRVDNSCDPVYSTNYAKFAKVGMLESCTGIDDISGNQAPFDASNPTKNWIGTGSGSSAYSGWFKWFYAAYNKVSPGQYGETITPDSGERSWVLIANERSLFILPSFMPSTVADHLKMTYAFAVVEKESGLKQTVLAASNKYSTAMTTIFAFSALTSLSSALFASVRNIKGDLANTKYMQHVGAISQYSAHTSAFTVDTGDGVTVTPLLLKDQVGFFAGELDLIRYVFYDISAKPNISTYTDNNHCYLLCRTLFQAESNYGFQIGGWCFELGEMF